MKIDIPEYLVREARNYAENSRRFTSDRHDFHEGGLEAKERKMYEGKLGEKAVKKLLNDKKVIYIEDQTPADIEDNFDFLIWKLGNEQPLKVDVKTRTKNFHTRTLEMVEQMRKKPKDIYISVRLLPPTSPTAIVLGFVTKEDFIRINRIENNGYLNNYVVFDNELRNIDDLVSVLKKHD